MLRILIFLAVLLIALLAFTHFLRRTGMFFPDRYPTGRWNPQDFSVVPVEHTFAAKDGVKLHGWWFEAADPNAPVMIWFHGNAGNLTDRADMAAELAKRGIAVFVFDYRGFGRSEGSPSESKIYRDALAAFDYVAAQVPRGSSESLGAPRRQPPISRRTEEPEEPRNRSRRPVVLYGESIGGPYAAYVAKERKGVRCVVLENSFPSLKDLGNALYHPLPLGWAAPFAMNTTAWLNQAGVPVLVMHGTRDAVIPYALGRKLYDGLRVPKEMLTSPAGHCEIPLFDAARYYQTITRFVKTAGGPA